MKNLVRYALALFGASTAAAAPAPIALGQPVAYQQIMTRLLSLQPGQKFEGVRQENNYVFLRNWEYRRKVANAQNGQQIHVFFNGYDEKAIAWVEPKGVPIPVPPAPADVAPGLDLAIDLAGNEVTTDVITADGKIYVFRFRDPNW